jgi:LacI family transcriptional regulator
MSSGRLTIKEIAEAAGVSTQTVSRVLNNRPDVAPDTFDRVQKVITETGYAPNLLARGLIQGRSQILGVVAYGLDLFGPSRILMSIEGDATELGYAILLSLIRHPETDDVAGLLNGLLARRVDGILWAIPEIGDNRTWVRGRNPALPVPIVFVGGAAPVEGQTSISIDNRAIGRLATDHLIEGGARCVGMITGPMTWWEARERRAGWRESLRAHGLQADDRLVVEGDWTEASGEEGLHRLLRASPDLDAVFASNDQMGLGVLRAAHALGKRVPDEIAVVGVDNNMSSHFWPSLSTIHQPLLEAGATAVKEMADALLSTRRRHRDGAAFVPRQTLLAPTLIARESSRGYTP